mmetsp:Transcript_129761/g.361495  ORF Transcript_129761/g.361495 Transcript_129761/m.361495 type:complete len:430 (-) Transcript_129761:30-1319(-)
MGRACQASGFLWVVRFARLHFDKHVFWKSRSLATCKCLVDAYGAPRDFAAASGSSFQQWAAQDTQYVEVTVTHELIEKARHTFHRRTVLYLHHVVAVAFPHLPTKGAASRSLKRGDVIVSGAMETASDALAPPIGALLRAQVGKVDELPDNLQQKVENWNSNRSGRPEAQLRVLAEETEAGWAVVNKPAGMHSSPCPDSYSRNHLTFEHFLPALVYPPQRGTRSRRPHVCHRLDFRVSGPIVITTTDEAARAIKAAFAEHRVRKVYHAAVCGAVGGEGDVLTVDEPIDGKPAFTDVQVERVVPCPHCGSLSELSLRPRTGRYHQLRRHCAEVLGAPIVNEEPPIFQSAARAWQCRHGRPLPRQVKRAKGTLFLQAVEVGLPAMEGITQGALVRTEVSDRFEKLLQQSQAAWERGWRMNSLGHSYRLQAQ